MPRTSTRLLLTLVLGGSLALSSCSLSGAPPSAPADKTVVVATHDSWAMSKKVLADFTKRTGLQVRIEENGDAGELTNKLVLTKGNPIADMEYGIDNTFATRAIDHGVLASYAPPDESAAVRRFAVPHSGAKLTPIDYADVCVNVDNAWFARHHLAPPSDFADLTKPAYKNLFVTPAATTSSPGMAFLVATIGRFGTGWQSYWRKLMANGAEVTSGWTEAFDVDYTAGGGKHGDRPIVLSYSSDPAYSIPKGGSKPTTSALLNTCFRQVEYAGVLAGARNPAGARKFIDFMLSREFQRALPDEMYVYPVLPGVALPADWHRFARTSPDPVQMSAARITAQRNTWLQQWQDIVTK